MDISRFLSDDRILAELGERLAYRRVKLQLTQAQLAAQAGVAKRTVERIETGASAQMSSVIRLLRALDLLPNLEQLLPPAAPSPMDLLRGKGKRRQRASSKRKHRAAEQPWSWDEES